jgi:NADH:ubiquinone oxidoreductase subunit 4 (subunit M)
MQTTFFGEAKNSWEFPDLSIREMMITAVMVIAIVWTGLNPQPVFNTSADSMDRLQRIIADHPEQNKLPEIIGDNR